MVKPPTVSILRSNPKLKGTIFDTCLYEHVPVDLALLILGYCVTHEDLKVAQEKVAQSDYRSFCILVDFAEKNDLCIDPEIVGVVIRIGCLKGLKLLIRTKRFEPSVDMLRWASRHGQLRIVKWLCTKISEEEFWKFILVFDPFMEAARSGHVEVLDFLIDTWGITESSLDLALRRAAEYKRENVLDYLYSNFPSI